MSNQENNVKPLKAIIEQIIQQNGWEEEIILDRIQSFWSEIVGEIIAKRTKVNKLMDKKLYIQAESSVWISELLIRKEQIIIAINTYLKAEKVKEIIVR